MHNDQDSQSVYVMDDNPFAAPNADCPRPPSRYPRVLRCLFESFAGFLTQTAIILSASITLGFTRSLREDSISFVACVVIPSFVGGVVIAKRSFEYPRTAAVTGLTVVSFAFAAIVIADTNNWLAPLAAAIATPTAAWAGTAAGSRQVANDAGTNDRDAKQSQP